MSFELAHMSETEMTSQSPLDGVKRSPIGEGVLIAAAAVIAHALAFVHEKAFCDYFEIPPTFISVDLTTVLVVLVILLGSALAPALIFHLIKSVGTASDNPISRRAAGLAAPMTSLYIFGLLTGD